MNYGCEKEGQIKTHKSREKGVKTLPNCLEWWYFQLSSKEVWMFSWATQQGLYSFITSIKNVLTFLALGLPPNLTYKYKVYLNEQWSGSYQLPLSNQNRLVTFNWNMPSFSAIHLKQKGLGSQIYHTCWVTFLTYCCCFLPFLFFRPNVLSCKTLQVL